MQCDLIDDGNCFILVLFMIAEGCVEEAQSQKEKYTVGRISSTLRDHRLHIVSVLQSRWAIKLHYIKVCVLYFILFLAKIYSLSTSLFSNFRFPGLGVPLSIATGNGLNHWRGDYK